MSHKENGGYDAVEGTIKRCVSTKVNWDEIAELKIIGIDEVAMKKGRDNYVAIISSQQVNGRVRLLGVLNDRKKETVRKFLESLDSGRKCNGLVPKEYLIGHLKIKAFSRA